MTQNRIKFSKGQRGFTMIELAVVVLALLVLAALAAPKMFGANDKIRNAAAADTASTLAAASQQNVGVLMMNGGTTGAAGPYSVTGVNAAVCNAATLQKLIGGRAILADDDSTASGNGTYVVSPGAGSCNGGGSVVTCIIAVPSSMSSSVIPQTTDITCTS